MYGISEVLEEILTAIIRIEKSGYFKIISDIAICFFLKEQVYRLQIFGFRSIK
jgi:hypothetical protein